MFSSFKCKAKGVGHSIDPIQDRIAAGMVDKCVCLQLKWAAYLQGKSERLSNRVKKCWLMAFCLLSVGSSLYMGIKSFGGGNNKTLIVTPINVPVHSSPSVDKSTHSFLIITKDEIRKIERFRLYMDSLGRSLAGKKTRDSILLSRPGLMDSIRVVESLYQLQSSKK
jgi:hypothetical protein